MRIDAGGDIGWNEHLGFRVVCALTFIAAGFQIFFWGRCWGGAEPGLDVLRVLMEGA